MTMRPHGKHVSIDEDNPDALGICDYTGFVHNRRDLVQQMDWRGNAIVWTGLFVGRQYADKPNEQLRPPILPPDPVPVRFPRVMQPTIVTWSQGQPATWANLPVYDWVSWTGQADGIPCLPEAQRYQALQTVYFGG
jgi:hypothetical protein